MKILPLTLSMFFLIVSSGYGQEKIYFNQTEFGASFGRGVDDWNGESETRIAFSMSTFHGVRFGKHHVGGVSFGFDQYETVSIIPVSFGWRGLFGKDESKLVTGFDLGGGTTFLERTEKTAWGASWYEGGLMLSPSVGGYFPGKRGKTALTVTLAYKRQGLSHYSGVYDQASAPRPNPFSGATLPDGFSSLTETSYLFHSLVTRIGLSF